MVPLYQSLLRFTYVRLLIQDQCSSSVSVYFGLLRYGY